MNDEVMAQQWLPLQQPLQLPCGAVLKNRLIKAAMSDSLGDGCGDATEAQCDLYRRWAEGGVALSIIGEVQCDARYPEKPGNLVLGPGSDRAALRRLAASAALDGAQLWPQIGHAGALSHAPISEPAGPSALQLPGLHCKAMSLAEVQALPQRYAKAAALAREVGFAGLELHAGHGFLLSQFLSPLFNHRNDRYGGSLEARARIVLEIIDAVRRAVGAAFPVAIKINASDQLDGGLSADEALGVVELLAHSSVDLIDISGGTYFPGAKASSEQLSSGGPYFQDFARRARARTTVPLMLTGGIKTRQHALDALASGAVDAVGIARALALQPDLANIWCSERGGDPEFPVFETTVPGGVSAWYTQRLSALAGGGEADAPADLQHALRQYESRDAARCPLWRAKFLA